MGERKHRNTGTNSPPSQTMPRKKLARKVGQDPGMSAKGPAWEGNQALLFAQVLKSECSAPVQPLEERALRVHDTILKM